MQVLGEAEVSALRTANGRAMITSDVDEAGALFRDVSRQYRTKRLTGLVNLGAEG